LTKLRFNINGKELTGYRGQTILDAAKENGIEIPTLCYDERVAIYGSCGLCVVEAEGIPKLLRACATEIAEGMIIKTHTPRTISSRKIALELLLSDHTGDCQAPCVLACPGHTDCQGYVGLIANGEHKEALKLIKEQLPLPASIGRVCPHPCEEACRRQMVEEPISIAWLKRFAADVDLQGEEAFMPEINAPTGKTIAIIGGGPGGLTAAYYLAQEGHNVTIYDAMSQMGGMLRYGIPQYRLPKEVLDKEIAIIEKMGVTMRNNVNIGKDTPLETLRKTYDVVYLSIGAWESTRMNCPGEDLEGVMGGIHFLRGAVENQPMKIGNKVAVVGGGNTAMDSCRTAVRMGAKEVYNIYRRTKEEMPAEAVEILEAEEEGVIFKFLVSPIEIIEEEGKVSKIRLQKMELGEPDQSGRRRPVPIEGEEEILEVDSVIAAIGQAVKLEGFEALELTRKGTIYADEATYMTNLPGVFAGGDATGDKPRIAIQAIGDAKKAVGVIKGYLRGDHVPYRKPYLVTQEDLTEADYLDKEKIYRPSMSHLKSKERKNNFNEVVTGYTEEAAIADAKRCLECGCHDYFECKLFHYANEYKVEPERLTGEVHKRQIENTHPFIQRNPDKCILCGLCVRICEEVMGATALGIVDRGFDAIVRPAFDAPLKETSCISCGQCISVCPTGALLERLPIKKSVPVETNITETICASCSVGCHINLNTKGDLLLRALPDKKSTVDEGLLCVKGRFGFDTAQRGERITKPLLRKEGKLKEVTWEEALLYTAKKAQSISLLHGKEALALSVSDRYTNEEIYMIKKLGEEILQTENITSFNSIRGGIKDVLGYDASSNTFEELLSTDTILLIGSDIMKDHTIVGLKIIQAVKKGTKLLVINPCETSIDQWAHSSMTPENNLHFLKEIGKALLEMNPGLKEDSLTGLEKLKEDLKEMKVSKEAEAIAKTYCQSKNAMIIFDQSSLTEGAAKLIANMAVISGHIGKPRRGIIQLKPNNNSQGLVDMGIQKDPQEIAKAIKDRTIQGLMVFSEDIPEVALKNLSFLMVQDTHLTQTAMQAHVVLPAASFDESQGTYTSSERKIQKVKQGLHPKTTMENWQVIKELAKILGTQLKYTASEAIYEEICQRIPEYFKGEIQNQTEDHWPRGKSPVLYTDGYHFSDKKARLQTVKEGPLFQKRTNTNNLVNTFAAYLKKEELI
jgi:formate dehydrogenase major subunit